MASVLAIVLIVTLHFVSSAWVVSRDISNVFFGAQWTLLVLQDKNQNSRPFFVPQCCWCAPANSSPSNVSGSLIFHSSSFVVFYIAYMYKHFKVFLKNHFTPICILPNTLQCEKNLIKLSQLIIIPITCFLKCY